jgi:macrodomain Ter protein organizer (MatP/YcbG family)
MKTIIDIEINTWANVKHFATVEKISLSKAVETLIKNALSKFGYTVENQGERIHE